MTEKTSTHKSAVTPLVSKLLAKNQEEEISVFTDIHFNTPFLLTKHSLYFVYPDETINTAGYNSAVSLAEYNEECIKLTQNSKKAKTEEGILDTGIFLVFAVFIFFTYFFDLSAGILWGSIASFVLLGVVVALEIFISYEMPEAPMDDFWLANECLRKTSISLKNYKEKISEEVFEETFEDAEKLDENSEITFAIEQNENGLFYGKIEQKIFGKK